MSTKNGCADGDLIHLPGGQPNTSVSNTFGIGNLPEYGVPTVTTAGGPPKAGSFWRTSCGMNGDTPDLS